MKKIETLFISGKMSSVDKDDKSRNKFNLIKQNLESKGFKVITALDIFDANKNLTEKQHRALFLSQIAISDAVVVTKGWKGRRGSRIDLLFASEYNIPCFTAKSMIAYHDKEDGNGIFSSPIKLILKDPNEIKYIEEDVETSSDEFETTERKLYLATKQLFE